MKTFRISTEEGDSYTIEARDLAEARKYANHELHCRFTVYEDKPTSRRWK